jgi:hypothetical protein
VFEDYVVYGKELTDALSICCTCFTIAAGLHPFMCSPNLIKSLSYSMDWEVKLGEEENQNQGGKNGSGKVLTIGRMWEENEVEQLSEHILIEVLISKNSLSQ